MKLFSQLDEKWSAEKIGKSGLRIGRWGCTITAICMALSKFTLAGQLDVTPAIFARKYGKFTSRGLIIWGASLYPRGQFIGRVVGYPLDSTLKKIVENRDKTVIVEVDKYHWLAVSGIDAEGRLNFFDPWGGVEIKDFKKSRYRKITKYVVFGRAE